MADEKKSEEQFYLPPPKLSKWEGFKLFMWNSDSREFMGRTAGSWGKVGLFYLIFYAGLAAFFAVMLVVFYQTLDAKEPKWKMGESVIGKNPGLGFRPMPPETNSDSTLIWFKHGDSGGTWHYYKEHLDEYFDDEHYGPDVPDKGAKPDDCVKTDSTSCSFKRSVQNWGKCLKTDTYGFKQGTPCILIKLNKIFGWMPDPINFDTLKDDSELRKLLQNVDRPSNETAPHGMVWLTCDGENPADKENIGTVSYYPYPGFSLSYFPYTNEKGYMAPYVFAQFDNIVKGVLVNVECRAWAHNIEHARQERRGSVHFELMVD